eukprot:TRINITY_DN70136_c0_g1_i1.p1 TRINITY_DN70136_c0_g1~~TRINITY_DN70136_c0_g1_i1.p1  ORF type:complete len:290 (-),score=43.54 TRINITY_DN70136_c0_g1_i1:40-909(-)
MESPRPVVFAALSELPKAAEALAVETTRAFAKGLLELVERVAAEVHREQRRLTAEAQRLSEERALFEQECRFAAACSREINSASDASRPETSSAFASVVTSGAARCEAAERGSDVIGGRGCGGVGEVDDERTERNRELSRFGGDVYRLPSPSGLSVPVSGFRYAVLPPAEASDNVVRVDMFGQDIEVPFGWETACVTMDGFTEVIESLANSGWGTSLLCAQNGAGGIASFRTILYTHGGEPGQEVARSSKVLQEMDSTGRRFRFASGMVLSGRLVIRQRTNVFTFPSAA